MTNARDTTPLTSGSAAARSGGGRPALPAGLGRRPLSEVLRPDGSIDTAKVDGDALDTSGYAMAAGPGGAPRFVEVAEPETAAPAGSTANTPLPADAAWSTVFGSPTLGPDTFAVAVSGDTVYVGGNFIYGMAAMASHTYNRVAMWDGSGWRRMGDGVDAAVHAIAVVGSDVYVGGEFTVAGGTVAAEHLARWDGESWSSVAGGVTDPDRSYGTTVRALVSDGSTLYVGGTFTRAGGTPVRSLAAVDLESGTWSGVGGGVASSWTTEPAAVHALARHGTSLYVGGSFDLAGETAAASFARLDTATGTWTAYGAGISDDGMTGTVNAVAVDDTSGAVYVGGRFTTADAVESWNLAVLHDDGFGSLGNVSSYGGKYAEVFALAVADGTLYAGGSFTTVGNVTASHWARYDGGAWSVPGDGVENVVKAMATRGDGVVVLGDFTVSGTLRVHHGATWTGAAWRTFGQGVISDPFGNGTVSAIVPIGAGAYVGGLFDQAGHLPVGSVARWTGSEWDPMAGGVGATHSHGRVFAMAQIGTDLYVAGSFVTAGGIVVNNIARWDGAAWSPLGEGVDDTVFAMAVLGGRLYVGGTFNVAGRVAAGHLACWDPATREWSPVGNSPTYDHDIKALAVIGDRWLVVGGVFHRFFHRGTTIVEGLWGMALFDTGHELTDDVLSGYYHLEGTSRYGAPGWVHTLLVLGGDLYVGGWFDVAGIMTLGEAPSPGFAASNLAVWHFAAEGSRWDGFGGADHQVQALTEVDGTLAAGGWFTTAGNAAASRVARYDPATQAWSALGSGLGDGARGGSWALSLASGSETGLWVGGEFPSAGAAPSANLACWTTTGGGD